MRYPLVITAVVAPIVLGALAVTSAVAFSGETSSSPSTINYSTVETVKSSSEVKKVETISTPEAVAPVAPAETPVSAPVTAPVVKTQVAPVSAPAPVAAPAPAAPACQMADTPIPGYQMCATVVNIEDIQIVSEPTAPQYETLFR